MILITGGAGFIGSNFIHAWLEQGGEPVINLDKLTYAGNPRSLPTDGSRHLFVRGDICDTVLVASLLAQHRPRAIVHFAAESHVDRSIQQPADFVATNINGTFSLLQAAREYWNCLPADERTTFRFLNISTDEVYGSLSPDDAPFSEVTAYAPNSPYSASKAAADHLVRSFHHTYGLPTLTTNCSNNYGPRQFPEKLIPLLIANALEGKPLPIYGDGQNVRDWLYVDDHCAALCRVLANGMPGQTYNIGGWNEKTTLDVAHTVCDLLDHLSSKNGSYRDQIAFVKDRPGHDRRYAIDARKIERELGWKPEETFESGMQKTIQWYLNNQDWMREVQSGDYLKRMSRHYCRAELEHVQ